MNYQEDCLELFMEDVVRIDFIPTDTSVIPVPYSVANRSRISGATLASPLLVVNLVGDALANARMTSLPQHKVTQKREAAGIVRTHTLQIPIDKGFQNLRAKEESLKMRDFHIVLWTNNGSRYLAYALPNTSDFSLEEQMGSSAVMTIKASVSSMSGLILLVNTN